MRISEVEVNRAAGAVVHALFAGGFIKLKVDEKQIAARVGRVILDSLRAEEALEHEAEEIAARLGRQAEGMDRHRIIEGIKARLAKERGFPL